MDSLIFSLNATVPVFMMMLLGMLFRRLGWIDEAFAEKMNQFVFLVPLPVLVFKDLADVEFDQVWDGRLVLFCFVVTLLSIGIATAISFLWKDRSFQGEFIQVSYRSSAALIGAALFQNMYGSSEMISLMIIGSVPLYNAMAVVVLSLFREENRGMDRKVLGQTLKGIVTNPIIIGIVAGLLWSLLRIPMPEILGTTVDSVAGIATPLGLLAMGATFDWKKATEKGKPAFVAAGIKLIGFCALFLPLSVWMGFRGQELAAILVMLGSATTVSCYVMARNMGHDGVLTSSTVMLTTLLSAFTLTGWIYVLRAFGLL